MPCKNPIEYEARREAIERWIDELLRNPSISVDTVAEAIRYIAENKLFVDPSTVHRARIPYQEKQLSQEESVISQGNLFNSQQLSFNFN